MELVTILLSALMAAISPAGLLIDKTAESAIRDRLQRAEQLQVRVDNAPTYQLLQGKVEKVRVAGRGLWLTPEARIDTLEVETDPISLDVGKLQQGSSNPRELLQQPVQAGVRLVLAAADINQILRSPSVANQLRQIASSFTQIPGAASLQNYEFINPQVEFLGNGRLRLQVELESKDKENSAANIAASKVSIESGLNVLAGRKLQLVDPAISLDGTPLPPALVKLLVGSFSDRVDLASLEEMGITARILKLTVRDSKIELAAFARLVP